MLLCMVFVGKRRGIRNNEKAKQADKFLSDTIATVTK